MDRQEEIKSGILEVVRTLKLDRMPTRSEMESHFGNASLSNKISKTGGFQAWAKELNIKWKESSTSSGTLYEDLFSQILRDKDYDVLKMMAKHPFDILVNGKVKIDVKSARPYLLKGSRVHTFGINKRYGGCDLYAVIALDEQDEVERIFIIPAHRLQIVTMSIGSESKYDCYLYRFDLIDKYDKFLSQL